MKRFLSHIYGAAVAWRNRGYDRGRRAVTRLDIPVLSVGNITAGGTGKTPLVLSIAERLHGRGRRVAVVTRGYRRATTGNLLVSDGRGRIVSARDGGDEAVMMARRLPDLLVIADEERARGCLRAQEEFGADAILLDDAFQHRAVHRDLDIVVLDASEGLDGLRLLPEGRLREPLANLRRADVIVLGKCESSDQAARLRRGVAAWTNAPVFATRFAAHALRRLGDEADHPLETLAGGALGAFCGIGRPDGFRSTLDQLRLDAVLQQDFADHHWYDRGDLQRLAQRGRDAGVQAWITTEKDAVRLRDGDAWRQLGDVWYPRMDVVFFGVDEQAWYDRIEKAMVAAERRRGG